MQKEKFCPGDRCKIVKLRQGGFHFEARKSFAGKEVEFVRYGRSSFGGGDFIACTLRLLENICTNEKTREYMLKGYEFYFPCVKLKKATR